MEFIYCFSVHLVFVMWIVFSSPEVTAQSLPESSKVSVRQLDALLQDYTYRSFVRLVHPKTGRLYNAPVPANLSTIKLTAMRLRSGSLRSKGVHGYNEFEIPDGIIAKPYVLRLILVFQNLGNLSSFYYGLQGYRFLAPVLGLLAYDATNLSATGLPELDITLSKGPISIQFRDVETAPSGSTPKCVWFDLDALPQFSDLESSNVCSTSHQGHFSIVVESTAPAPAPVAPPSPVPAGPNLSPGHGKNKSKAWKIAVPVVGGFILLVLFVMLLVWLIRYRQNKKMAEMERQADIGEALQMTSIGHTRAPVAMGTRTPPSLENEYVP
ncbi:uncharacterized protein LOC131253675 [Magnolia sinica]|uniref:uncharacterized protein LOC131253675 n=1 Tax=Magnolia sinica TaxID=86752 RepID=UPI00265A9F09|nr:uncharacterized protein LOC131253675 [Magnolia sinica]